MQLEIDLPYRGKVTKFLVFDENFPRRILSPTIYQFQKCQKYEISRMGSLVEKC